MLLYWSFFILFYGIDQLSLDFISKYLCKLDITNCNLKYLVLHVDTILYLYIWNLDLK
jgi:hypothetical protein